MRKSLNSVCLVRELRSEPCDGNPKTNLGVACERISPAYGGALERIASPPEGDADAEPLGGRHFR